MAFPSCFDDEEQYLWWHNLARLSSEKVTICMDCSTGYEAKMASTNRCDKPKWSRIAFKQTRVMKLDIDLTYENFEKIKSSRNGKPYLIR